MFFYNISPINFERLVEYSNNLAAILLAYIIGFSDNMYEVLEKFDFLMKLSLIGIDCIGINLNKFRHNVPFMTKNKIGEILNEKNKQTKILIEKINHKLSKLLKIPDFTYYCGNDWKD